MKPDGIKVEEGVATLPLTPEQASKLAEVIRQNKMAEAEAMAVGERLAAEEKLREVICNTLIVSGVLAIIGVVVYCFTA